MNRGDAQPRTLASPPAWVAVGLALFGMLAIGCGERRFPVEGRVVYEDGSPYSGGGVVVMETTVGTKAIMKRAPIGPDGKFQTAAGAPSGTVAGTYRVRILPAAEDDEADAGKPPAVAYDRKFLDFDTSGLEWVVGPDGSSSGLVIDLGRRPAPR